MDTIVIVGSEKEQISVSVSISGFPVSISGFPVSVSEY